MKRKLFLIRSLALFVAAAVMFSCQKEEVLNDDVQLKSVTALDNDCDCIEEADPLEIETTASNTGVKANVTVWNDNDNFYIKVEPESGTMDKVELSYPISYKTTNNANCNSTGIDYNIESSNVEAVATYTFTFPLEGDWACTDAEFALIAKGLNGGNVSLNGPLYDREFTYTYNDKGSTVTTTKECEVPGAISYTLYEICEGCDESFSYVDNKDGSYTFIYTPAEDMPDADLVFTFPQDALDGEPLTGWTYKGQTMQTTMSLEACETYTWTVSLTCKVLNNPQNKWTDFKVGEDSMKDKYNLENIKCD